MVDIPQTMPDTLEGLDDLEQKVRARFEEVQAEAGSNPSDEQLDEMEALAEALDLIDGKRTEIEDRASRASAAAARFASAEDDAEDTETIEGDEFTATGAGDTEAAEPSAEANEADTEGDDFAAEADDNNNADNPSEEGAGEMAQKIGGAVQSAAPADTEDKVQPVSPFSLSTAAENFAGGRVGLSDLAEAMEGALRGRSTIATADTRFAKSTFGHINRDFPEGMTVNTNESAEDAIAFATDEGRLNGQSLVAAAGWCAPSETLYDFLPMEPAEGLLSMPEIGVSRGGIRYPVEPDFSALYAHEDFLWTEADAIAGDKTKACVEIPCVGMEEERLDAVWACVTSNLLANTGWPELTERFLGETFRAYEHRKSSYRLSKVQADAIAVTAPASSVLGAAAAVLNAAALQAKDLQAKYRTSRTIEVLAPSWVLELMKADLAYREGVLPDQIQDSRLVALFAERNMSVQFLADLAPLGQSDPATAWPDSVTLLMYPAGAWFSAVQPVVNLAAQYSPELLSKNQRSELFIEDGVLAARRGFETRALTVPVTVAGQVGQRVALGGATGGAEGNG